jgi:hypothetical protein
MTNNYFASQGGAGAACSGGFINPQHCPDSPDYLGLVEVGIFPQVPIWNLQPFDRSTSIRSQYIEVFAPDVDPPKCNPANLESGCGYPSAIWQAHTELVDYTPPVIVASANPATLWPPRGQVVQTTISGTMTDDLSGVNRATAQFSVQDEYGVIQPSGPVPVDANGGYSFTIALQAQRNGADLDGRHYEITLTVQDNAGNVGRTAVTVVVPHDLGH